MFRMSEVSRGVARISFKWTMKKGKVKEVKNIVLPGLIVSSGIIIDGDTEESTIVIVDATFFTGKVDKACSKKVVELPVAKGRYEKHAAYELIHDRSDNYLCALKLTGVTQEIKSYISPLMFETSLIGQGEIVYSFVFPTEGYMTPTAYCPGCTIDAHNQLVIHGCHIHEYAHFGSPLLNPRGHLIGISSSSQGQTQAWSVKFLSKYFLISKLQSVTGNIAYLENGTPRG